MKEGFKKVGRKRREKGIKKTIILMAIALSIIILVNNTFTIIESNLYGMRDTADQRTIEMQMDFEEYEEMGKEILSKIDTSVNKHIVAVYTGGMTRGYENGEAVFFTHRPQSVLSEYMNVSKNFQLADDDVLLPKYCQTDEGDIERKEADFVGKTIEYTLYKDKITYETEEDPPIIEHLEEKTYTLKVAGLYDNVRSGDGESVAIVSENTLVNMKFFTELVQGEDSVVITASMDTNISICVTVDDYKNVDEVAESLENVSERENLTMLYPMVNESYFSEEYYSVEAVRLLANFVAAFLAVAAGLSLLAYIKDMLNRRKREFGIMKAIGYRTSGICRVLLKELIFEITIPLGIAWLLGIISVAVTDNILKKSFDLFDYAMFDIRLYGNVLALIAGISVMIPLIGYIIMIVRINRLEPVEALK